MNFFKKLFKKPKAHIVGHITAFPVLKYHRMLVEGKMTRKQYAELKESDLRPVKKLVWSDEL